ncbi:MAG TPA: transcription termination/antitermination protein NusA, partial [Anaerolineae bacterium]|nr:transcription termination/antitermination protein NusA [Anaerolineae bacterium]
MRSDFMLAINQLCAERKLSPEVVLEAVEASLISAYRRNFGAANNVEVKIEPNSGDVRVYAAKTVVETVTDPKIEISLEEARRLDPNAEVGQEIRIESTPRDFGRIAAQTAKQVILQRIREAEREAVYNSFADSAGEIAHGTIQSVDYHSGDVIVNLDRAEAILPVREQVPSERYRRGSRLRAYVLDVRRGSRGPQITLSRRTPNLLRRLLELEVPEIFNGVVEIKGIAREAGSRSKVAVYATQPGVDPVGSCVGVRGGRIQNVVNELGGEKIDVVQWDPDTAVFIANALSPAKVMNVLLDNDPENGKTATVIVPDRQLSLAIGKEGQNARLAAKLTGWRIDIKSATEATEETWGKLEDIPVPPEEMDLLALAENLLRQRDEAGFSEEEKEKIEAAVTQADELLAWPEEPPTEAEPAAEAEEAVAETTSPAEAALAAEAAPPVEEETPEAAEPVEEAALPIVEEEEEPPAELPSFEDETVDDSLGWIRTEPEEPYMWGWGEPEEEVPETEEKKDWILDDLEEEARRKPPKKKKKRGKKRKD